DLGSRRPRGGRRESGICLLEPGMRGDRRERRQGADFRGRARLDIGDALHPRDGDHRGRGIEALLHAVEENDASGLEGRVGLDGLARRIVERAGLDQDEGFHDRPPFRPSSTAARTTSGVIGMRRMRAPTAWETALAIAAAVGTVAGSPIPTEWVLLMPSQTGTKIVSISGQSSAPAIL